MNTFQLSLNHDEDKWFAIFMDVMLCGYIISLMVSLVLVIKNQGNEERLEQLSQLRTSFLIAYTFIMMLTPLIIFRIQSFP